MWPSSEPMESADVISSSAVRAKSTAASRTSSATGAVWSSTVWISGPVSADSVMSSGSGIQFFCNFPQHGCNLATVRALGIAAAAQVGANAIEELHEVFDDDRHVVGRLAVELGHARRGLDDSHGERLRAALAIGNTELQLGTGLDRGSRGQRRSVEKDLVAVIGCDEAEAFFLVVELDLAGGHLDLAVV